MTEPVAVEWHTGPRAELRGLFELAEDSAQSLDSYIDLGRVLVATRGSKRIGHLQLAPRERPGEIEIVNMAVVPEEQGGGVGRVLIETALRHCSAEGWTQVFVATATASTGNLRFYQRLGFRMHSVERDAFTPATGYPDPPMEIDGVPLRDKVWLSQEL